MKKVFVKTGLFFNWFFALLLILSGLSVYINPSVFPYTAILGLSFPFLLLINVIFLFFRIFGKKVYFLVSLIAILLSYYRIQDSYAFKKQKVIGAPVNKIKVFSYNVRMFDYFNWTGKQCGDSIFSLIEKENADIVCLQEFYSRKGFNYQKKISKKLHYKYFVHSSENTKRFFGSVIFSKYPIVASGTLKTDQTLHRCIYADIVKNRDTFRVYNVHLASVHLDKSDYEFMKNIDIKDNNIKEAKGIGKKLIDAYEKRGREAQTVHAHIQASPYKVIVCGDFNDTPVSYAYHKIKGNLKDAFIQSGIGIGHTYAKYLPFLRIDFIFHDKAMSTKSYKRLRKNFSDHFPISSEIEL